jgi:hypothetical protein
MIQGRVDGGERKLDHALAGLVVNIEPPRSRLRFATAHELVNDVLRIVQSMHAVGQRDASLVVDSATAVS